MITNPSIFIQIRGGEDGPIYGSVKFRNDKEMRERETIGGFIMGIGLSLTAILYSPVASMLWLVGIGVYCLFQLREVKLEPYSVGLMLLTMWSFSVAVFYESWVSFAASFVLACFFLFHQWMLSREWTRDGLERLMTQLFHLGTGTALIGWLQQMGQLPTEPGWFTWLMGWAPFVPISEERISGTFNNPNFAASWYAVLLILGMWMWERSARARRALVALEMLVLCGALYFTGSRGGMSGWLVGTFFYLFIRYRQRVLFFLAGAMALLMTVGFFRMEWLPRGELFWKSLDTRLEIWRTGLDLFLEKPLTGIGLANMWFVEPWMRSYPDPLPHAHNTLLSIAVELGIVGLGLFLWMQIFVIRGLVQLTAERDAFAPLFVGAFAVLAMQGLVDHPIFLPQVAVIFFGVSGVVLHLTAAEAQVQPKPVLKPRPLGQGWFHHHPRHQERLRI